MSDIFRTARRTDDQSDCETKRPFDELRVTELSTPQPIHASAGRRGQLHTPDRKAVDRFNSQSGQGEVKRSEVRGLRSVHKPKVLSGLIRNHSVGISDSPSPGPETTRGRPLPRAGEAGSPSSPASPRPTGGEAGRAPARTGEGDFIPPTASFLRGHS